MSQSIHLTHISTSGSEHSFNYCFTVLSTVTCVAVESATTVVSATVAVESVVSVDVVDSLPHAVIATVAIIAKIKVYFLIVTNIRKILEIKKPRRESGLKVIFVGSTPRTKKRKDFGKDFLVDINIYDFTKNLNIYTNFLNIFS